MLTHASDESSETNDPLPSAGRTSPRGVLACAGHLIRGPPRAWTTALGRPSTTLICQFAGLPSLAGREGTDCSASPTGTCSSCGRNDYILPRPQHSPLVCFQLDI